LWLLLRPLDRRRTLEAVAIVGSIALCALIPYLYLLGHRANNLEETQTLVFTHRPDLFRIPELLGILILILLIVGVRRHKLKASDAVFLIGASLLLSPLVLFNQQVVTGRSLQPFHFDHFIANYMVLAGLVIGISNWLRARPSRLFLLVAILCVTWGALEVDLPARVRASDNVAVDQMIPVFLRLRTLSFQDGTLSGLRDNGQTSTLVFSPQIEVLRYLPTWTAQGVMVGLGALDFGTATKDEQRVLSYLYFAGVDSKGFRDLLYDRTNDDFLNYYTRSAVFGHERILPGLSSQRVPVDSAELEDKVRFYEGFVRSFSREEALKHPITYVVVRHNSQFDFSRIDQWYLRDLEENAGDYDLYRVKLRTNE
jgi:hypothetical protein